MLINKVELRNVKSYAGPESIVFTPGVNAICGPNGAGKSTILEAIGFALFDALPYSQAQFLREGAKKGEVVVSFVDALDEREYQVVRPVGGGSPYIYDPHIKRRLTFDKADTIAWLKEHLGVEPTTELKALFLDAVGVPQGLLTAPFLETSVGKRKGTFDPLLQVKDYETAWERLREAARYLREELQEREKLVAGLKALLERLPDLEGEAEGLRRAIAEDEAALAQTVTRLEEVSAEKEALDAGKARLDELARRLEGFKARLDELARRLADAQAAVQEAESAQEVVRESEAGHRAYQAAQAELGKLEARRRERDELAARLTYAEQSLALVKREIERLEEELEAIKGAEERRAELAPLVERQEQLESALREAERDIQRWEEARRRAEEEGVRAKELEVKLRRFREQMETRRALEAEIAELEGQRRDLEAQAAEARAEGKRLESERRQLEERISLLRETEEAVCPVCRRPLEAGQAEELSAHYREELEALKAQDERRRRRLEEAEQALREVDERLAALRGEVGTLPHPAQEAELREELQAQQAKAEEWEARARALAETPRRVEELRAQLDSLGDPRREHERLSVEVEKRPQVEARLLEAYKERTAHEREKEALGEALLAYADLDEALARQQELLESHRPAHERYLRHLKIAETLPERREKAAALEEERRQVEEERAQAEAQWQEASAAYDEARHRQVEEEHRRLVGKRASLESALQLRRQRLKEVEAELAELGRMKEKLEEAEREREELQTLARVLEFIRNTLRDAGPYITRALVQTISLEANRIFGDIMADHTLRLQWGEDYAITVEYRGETRAFQQLSGGEQMAAALAVRLALLREMSGVDIAFFDEPTANLDDERRDNLAEQIAAIKGFSQLFIISHDDTFERMTHHVIRVRKENGVSRVETA